MSPLDFLKRVFGRDLFNRTNDLEKFSEIITWWEIRRIHYNIVVGITGIITSVWFLVCMMIRNAPAITPLSAIFVVLIYGLLANICYTAGWITEIIVKKLWKEKGKYFGEITFKLGLGFSILVTLSPAILITIVTMVSPTSLSLYYPSSNPRPLDKEIVGLWSLNQSSIDEMRHRGNYIISKHTLEFKDDMTFTSTNMPDWYFDGFGKSNGNFYSGWGTWKIREDQGWWSLHMSFEHHDRYPNGFGTSFYLRKIKNGLAIVVGIGDTDEGRGMIYEKIISHADGVKDSDG